MATIGKSIKIKGDVLGSEDATIEGSVEGRVVFKDHHLTIGSNGEVKGEISGKRVTVFGTVIGSISASERLDVQNSGVIEGDLEATNLVVAEGAVINGTLAMKERPVLAPPKELEVGPPPAQDSARRIAPARPA